MLGPANLSTSQLKVALKPTAGYEQQLYVSTQQYSEPGLMQLVSLNSGVYSANVADVALLAANPQELIAVLDTDVNSAAPIILTVTGLDKNNNPYTGVATFVPPSYVQTQEYLFPKGTAVDLITATNQLCQTITNVSVQCAADTAFVKIRVIGLPSFVANGSGTGAYRLVSTKTKLDYNLGVPDPHSVQDGRNKSAYIKPGEIPEAMVNIVQKIGSSGDGLLRINGTRVTGLVREVKEDKVETMRVFLPGLIITAEPSTGQSVEDAEATGKGSAERVAMITAH